MHLLDRGVPICLHKQIIADDKMNDTCPFSEDSCSILKQCAHDSTTAEECFCLILSLEGFENTLHHFSAFIHPLRNVKPKLHKQLLDVFKEYFSQTNTQSNEAIGCSVENGYLTSDIDFELDIELAKSLSLGITEYHPQQKLQSSGNDKLIHQNGVQPLKHLRNEHSFKEDTPFKQACIQNIPGLPISEQMTKKKRRKKGQASVPRPLNSKPVICWFRRDLRLYDNPAVMAASATNGPVIFVYIWSSREEDPFNVVAAGGATKLWLHCALKDLNKSLNDRFGNRILFYHAKHQSSLDILKTVCRQTGANSLMVNDIYEPFLKERDDRICKTLSKSGIQCNRFHSYLLHEPSSINTETLGMRGVGSVTHFMECCRQSAAEPIGQPVESPALLPMCSHLPDCDTLDDLELAKMPRRKDGSVVRSYDQYSLHKKPVL